MQVGVEVSARPEHGSADTREFIGTWKVRLAAPAPLVWVNGPDKYL
jgi:hypothetical protein